MNGTEPITPLGSRAELQERQYVFPYHHIPYFDKSGTAIRYRSLGWGLEYLCYTKHVSELVQSLSPRTLLDVGCGDGRFIGFLGSSIETKVGIDLSVRAIELAKALNAEGDYRVVDVCDVNERFDVVTVIETLEHIPDGQVPEFLRCLSTCVNPGGVLLLCVPTVVMKLSEKHYRHYTIELLEHEIEGSGADLKITHAEYVYSRSLLVFVYRKLTSNRFWFISVHWLRRFMWSYVWNTLRAATAKNGQHLVVVLSKSMDEVAVSG